MQAAVTFIRDAFNDDGFAFLPIRAFAIESCLAVDMLYCFGVPRKIEFAFAFVYFLTLSQDESRGKIFIPVGSKSGL